MISLLNLFLSIYLALFSIAAAIMYWSSIHPPEVKDNIPCEPSASAYHITKDGKQIGTLIGSFHTQLNYDEQEKFIQYFDTLLSGYTNVFTEIPLGLCHGGGGVDSALASASSKHLNTIKYNHFELLNTQKSMLTRALLVGKDIIHLPTTFNAMQKWPLLTLTMHNLIGGCSNLYNAGYLLLYKDAHTAAVNKINAAKHDFGVSAYRKYKEGIATELSPMDKHILCMNLRDEMYAERLIATDGRWLALIGVAHLAGITGLVANLKMQGYELEPFNIHKTVIKGEEEATP